MSTNQGSDDTVAPKGPMPCETGCGFFGSDATGNCCSKCWMEKLKQSHAEPHSSSSSDAPSEPSATSMKKLQPLPTEKIDETKIDETKVEPTQQEQETPQQPVPKATPAVAPVQKKKKKKKTSYKSLMATMTAGSTDRDVKKERETIQGLGGGNFSKLEKI